jgi:ATP-binding cassette subfamily B (MDR/TAP) protein 1
MDAAGRRAKVDAAALVALGSSVFVHADAVDVALMVLGLVGAIGDGMATPLRLLVASRIANDLGSGPDHLQQFTSKINAVGPVFRIFKRKLPS